MTVYQRVKFSLNEKDISIEDAAKLSGRSSRTIRNWFEGKNPIHIDFLSWLKKEYPELDMNWLFSGEGEMELEQKQAGSYTYEQLKEMERKLELVYLKLEKIEQSQE